MSRCWASITVLALAVAASRADASVLFSNSPNARSASASFEISGRQLTILLTNTDDVTGADAPQIAENTLIGLFFNLGTSTFTPKSATESPASIIQTGNCIVANGKKGAQNSSCASQTNVGGEFSSASGGAGWLAGTPQGTASSGYLNERTGVANFNGPDWEGPAALDGMDFGMVPDGWVAANQGLGNAALIEGIVKFVLDIPKGLAESPISNVNFAYGR